MHVLKESRVRRLCSAGTRDREEREPEADGDRHRSRDERAPVARDPQPSDLYDDVQRKRAPLVESGGSLHSIDPVKQRAVVRSTRPAPFRGGASTTMQNLAEAREQLSYPPVHLVGATRGVTAVPSRDNVGTPGQTLLARPTQNGARRSRFKIFPLPVFGSSGLQVTDRGIL